MKSSTDFIISPEAEQDIQEILRYSLETWGEDQISAYWSVIWDAAHRIRSFPEIGRLSPVRSGERELSLPHHTIFYRYAGNTVTILRIVNPRRKRR
jgi:toxin ParE1/3/4